MTDTPDLDASPLRHFIDRLQTALMIRDPYSHYCLDRVFPEAYYQLLLRHLPAASAYQNLFEITTLKLEHFRFRDQRDLADGWTASTTTSCVVFWDEFNAWFLGPELAHADLARFVRRPHASARFGERSEWPAVRVEAQLIRHQAGYFLGPHTDLSTKLVVLLFYLPEDDSHPNLGTSLYRPKESGFTCADSNHYPFDEFVNVKTAPYQRNSLLAFERSDRSFHGVEPLAAGDLATCKRDLIQYVLYDRSARQKRGSRLAAWPPCRESPLVSQIAGRKPEDRVRHPRPEGESVRAAPGRLEHSDDVVVLGVTEGLPDAGPRTHLRQSLRSSAIRTILGRVGRRGARPRGPLGEASNVSSSCTRPCWHQRPGRSEALGLPGMSESTVLRALDKSRLTTSPRIGPGIDTACEQILADARTPGA